MTKNQIEYFKLQESIRSAKAQEFETHRSNRKNEALTSSRDLNNYILGLMNYNVQRSTQAETARSNRAREAETIRYNNLVTQETKRSNQAREYENFRSNLAKEVELNRSNRAAESISSRNASINEINASTNRMNAITQGYNAQLRAAELGWLTSYQSAQLEEAKRHSLAGESEISLHNRVTEDQALLGLQISQQNANTNARSVNSAVRSVGETIRHNQASESISKQANVINLITGTARAILR